jgi:hypothetical protein
MFAGLGKFKDPARDERSRLVTRLCELKRAANFLKGPAHRLDCVGLEDEETWTGHHTVASWQP